MDVRYFVPRKPQIYIALQIPEKYQARGKSYTGDGLYICKTLLCNITWIILLESVRAKLNKL